MERIIVEATINAPVEKVWELYNDPVHVVKWNNPSPDWHTPRAENDLRASGTFLYRIEAVDGSAGFDFGGTYDEVLANSLIKYTLGDGRKVIIKLKEEEGQTNINVEFDAETENTIEKQRAGWQAILDNFKKYAESN